MTRKEKKERFGRYRNGHARIQELKEKRERAKPFGERATVSFGNLPKCRPFGTDRVQLAAERIAAIDAEIAKLKKNLSKWERETVRLVNSIDNAEYRRVMRYYYIEGLSWVEVGELTGYSDRHTRRINNKIIDELYKDVLTGPGKKMV